MKLKTLFMSCGACVLITATANAETITIGGTGMSIGMARHLAEAYMKKVPGVEIKVPNSVGSSGGIKAVLAGRFALSFASRPIKKKNLNKGLTGRPLVITPFVLTVSPKVGHDLRMSKQDVLKAYAGEITHWPDGTRVNVVSRGAKETNSMMLEANFDGISPHLARWRDTRGALRARTDQQAMDLAEKVPGALVTTTLLALRTEGRALEPIIIDGIVPNLDNLDSKKWTMSTTLHVISGQKTSPAGLAFLDYLYSPEVAEMLKNWGGLAYKKRGG